MCSYNQPTHSGSSWSCTLFVVVVICLFFPGRKKRGGRTDFLLFATQKPFSLFFLLSLSCDVDPQAKSSLARSLAVSATFFLPSHGGFFSSLMALYVQKVCQPTFSVKPGRGIAETRKGQCCISEMKSVGGFCTFTFPGERKKKRFCSRIEWNCGSAFS